MPTSPFTARVVVAPNHLTRYDNRPSVFLAGAIDMGNAVNWQQQAIEGLADLPCTIYNPRREGSYAPDMIDDQITWELNYLGRVDTILMWIPASALAPISLHEAGLFMGSGRLVIGVEPGFYRRTNLEHTTARWGVPLCRTLDQVIAAVRWEIGARAAQR